ncbi:hypothetical protein B0H13DRAFT_1931731, partial [Mycena leptocephala]
MAESLLLAHIHPASHRCRHNPQLVISSDFSPAMGYEQLPPSDPFPESDSDFPGLANIQCSNNELDDNDPPELEKVPLDKLTDDESDDSNDEEDEPPRINLVSSSPLSSAPGSDKEEANATTPTQAPHYMPWAHSSPLPSLPLTLTPVPGFSATGIFSSPTYTLRFQCKMELARREERRQATWALNKIAAKAAPDKKEKERVEAVAAAETKKTAHFARILDGMEEQQYSLADLLEYLFNRSTEFATGYDWRWHGFFAHKQTVKKIFSYWSSSVAWSAHTFVLDWAYGLVKKMMSSESHRIARSGLLSKTKKTVNEDFFLKYSLTGLSQTLCEMTPHIFGIFDAFSTTTHQLKVPSKQFQKKQDVLTGSAALALMNGTSQNNSYSQAVHGIYLMATGGQRQHFSILYGFGWTMGYTSIISQTLQVPGATAAAADTLNEIDGVDPPTPGRHAPKNKKQCEAKKAEKKRICGPRTLFLLSQACRATARTIAATDMQENGTCTTVVLLHNATLNALLAAELDKSIAQAPPLSIENLEFTETEGVFFLHLVPAMEIDENSTKGNIKIIGAMNTELGLDEENPNYAKYAVIDPIISLYARTLHRLLRVSGQDTLDDYANSCNNWETLAKGKKSSEAGKKEYPPHIKIGDMIFENALLFMRDALLTRKFVDAIKKGDSGRIVLILKQFTFTYRSNGRTKYTHEMLHILHNILNVWSDELRHVILHNWVLNPTSKLDVFVEVNLVQEHLNLWIK